MAMSAVTKNSAEDGEDLEKLQAEIARMEAEAARIAQETEELEKDKSSNVTAAAGQGKVKSGDGLVGAANEKSKKDG